MASKAANLQDLFKSNPEFVERSNADVEAAYTAMFGDVVSSETIRLGRKIYKADTEPAAAPQADSEPDYDAKQDVYEESLDDEPELDADGHETFGVNPDPADDYDTPQDDEPVATDEPQAANTDESADSEGDDAVESDSDDDDTAADDEPVADEDAEPQDDQPAEDDAEPETDPVAEAAAAAAALALENGEDPIAAAVKAATEAAEAAAHAQPRTEPEGPEITREPVEGRCNHRMVRAGDLCGRPAGHPGVHTTFTQLEKKKGFSKARAKVRYHSDPEYRERAKSASKASHAKARMAAKAAKEAAAAAETEKEAATAS